MTEAVAISSALVHGRADLWIVTVLVLANSVLIVVARIPHYCRGAWSADYRKVEV